MRSNPYARLQIDTTDDTQAMSETKENANHTKTGRAELALLVFGVGLLVFWGAARVESIIRSRAAVGEFNALDLPPSVSPDSTRGQGGASREPEAISSPSDGKKVQAQIESSSERTDVPLAVLRIPKIRLEAPVAEGTDSLTLNHAVGRIAGTARLGEPGNIGIAGHRDGFFRGLKDVTVGDTVELRTPTGTVTYKVDQVSIVAPEDVSVLNPKASPSLTLVTCYPFYFVGSAPQRYIVSASPERAPDLAVWSASIKSGQFY
jgi:sortase A